VVVLWRAQCCKYKGGNGIMAYTYDAEVT